MVSLKLFLLAKIATTAFSTLVDESAFPESKVVAKEVAVIGGGASGTYAAVRLREDLNTSIILIESQSQLGGHVDTYTVPETGDTLEYGVQSYVRYGQALEFFARFNISTQRFESGRLNTLYVDYDDSSMLTGYKAPAVNATNEAIARWLQILAKYNGLIEPGYWNFPRPESIPPEFLEPFSAFAKRNRIEAAVPRIAAISNVGVGGLSEIPTLHVMQAFGLPITQGVIAGNLFTPVGSNSVLYQKALQLLHEDVLLDSHVMTAERSPSGCKLVVNTPNGEILVKAKRLLFTPATNSALSSISLDERERQVFDPMPFGWNFAGVAQIPCIPDGYGISYTSSSAVPNHYLNIRDKDWTLGLTSTGPTGLGLFRVLFAGTTSWTEEDAKSFVQTKVTELVTAGSLNFTGECKVKYRAFGDHHSLMWPGTKEIKSGWAQKLLGLQGYKSTWWTGRNWSADYTTNVWASTEIVLQKLMKSLGKGYAAM